MNATTPEFPACDVPECTSRRNHEGAHTDAEDSQVGPCGVQRPEYEGHPAIGRWRLPCVAEQGHDGPHVSALRDTWENETEDAVATELFTVNACAAQLGRLLTTPGLPRDAAETLRDVATVWETFDSLLRTGAPLPSRWSTPRTGGPLAGVATTPVYESLCEALSPEPPGNGYSVAELPTLRSACRWWRSLDTVLRAGGALPEPWAEVAEGV